MSVASTSSSYLGTLVDQHINLPQIEDPERAATQYKLYGFASIQDTPESKRLKQAGFRIEYSEKDRLKQQLIKKLVFAGNQETDPRLKAIFYCAAKYQLASYHEWWGGKGFDGKEISLSILKRLEAISCEQAAEREPDLIEKTYWLLRGCRAEKHDSNSFEYNLNATEEDNQNLDRIANLWTKTGDSFSNLKDWQFDKLKDQFEFPFSDQKYDRVATAENIAAICYGNAAQAAELAFLQREKENAPWDPSGDAVLGLYKLAIRCKESIQSQNLSSWEKASLAESIAGFYQRMLFLTKKKGDENEIAVLKKMILSKRAETYEHYLKEHHRLFQQHGRESTADTLLRRAVNIAEQATYSPQEEKIRLFEIASLIALKIWVEHPRMHYHPEFFPNQDYRIVRSSGCTLEGTFSTLHQEAVRQLPAEDADKLWKQGEQAEKAAKETIGSDPTTVQTMLKKAEEHYFHAYNSYLLIGDEKMQGKALLRRVVNLTKAAEYSSLEERLELYELASLIGLKIRKCHNDIFSNPELHSNEDHSGIKIEDTLEALVSQYKVTLQKWYPGFSRKKITPG